MNIIKASETLDIEEFLSLAFPESWGGIAARILETGVTFSETPCKWAPRWSKIPPTVRYGSCYDETAIKSVIFRVHDCLHQLWGLPHPRDFSKEEFYYYKRSQMCGEVAVLTLAEFVYAKYVYDQGEYQELLWNRNAIPLLSGPMEGKTLLQIGMRLDDLLHKKSIPKWVRENEYAMKFVNDYVPMLEKDRQQIDINWSAMLWSNWNPGLHSPKERFGRHLDGLELTIWMLEDFLHLQSTSPDIDYGLMHFNRERRAKIILPDGWES